MCPCTCQIVTWAELQLMAEVKQSRRFSNLAKSTTRLVMKTPNSVSQSSCQLWFVANHHAWLSITLDQPSSTFDFRDIRSFACKAVEVFFLCFSLGSDTKPYAGGRKKTNKAPEINTASLHPMFCSMVGEGIEKRESQWETFLEEKKGLSFRARLPRLYEKRSVNTKLGAVDGHSEAKWNLCTLLFQRGRRLSNETEERRPVKNVCAIWQKHGQFLTPAHKGCVLFDVRHIPRHKALSRTVN